MRKTIHEDQIKEMTDGHSIQSKLISKISFDPITMHDGESVRIDRLHHQVHKIAKDSSIVFSCPYKELIPMQYKPSKKRSKKQQMQSARRHLKGSMIEVINLFSYHLSSRFPSQAISTLERYAIRMSKDFLEKALTHFDENTKSLIEEAELPEEEDE